MQGYWDKANTEIDLVAVNDSARLIRFGSCKRSPQKLLADVNNFKQHVQRFLKGMPKYSSWTTEYVAKYLGKSFSVLGGAEDGQI